VKELLEQAPVVPVVVIEDAAKAVPIAQALVRGGLPVIEITMRTAAAADAIGAVAESVPEAVVGAGTVLSPAQAEAIAAVGAKFIVSPGLHEGVVAAAESLNLPVVPGVATATEAQSAWNLGLRLLKFFPAGQAGGVGMLKALSAVFRDVMFLPTGGVSASNLRDYLEVPSVLACGGSWLTPVAAVEAGDFDKITALASEAIAIAREVGG